MWNASSHASQTPSRLLQLAQALWRRHGQGSSAVPLLHSVWCNLKDGRDNVILSQHWEFLLGDQQLTRQVS